MHHRLLWQLPRIVQKESYWLDFLSGNYNTWLLPLYKLCIVQTPVTFHANHVFTRVVDLCSNKPNPNKHASILSPPLPTIHNKNGKINIKIHNNVEIHHNNAKIQNYQHTIFLWPCDASWSVACVDFTIIGPKSLETLSLVITYWVLLFIACTKHAPSNGASKLNASHEITDFRVVVMIPKLIPSFLT